MPQRGKYYALRLAKMAREQVLKDKAERFGEETPPPICKEFGCGKVLSPTEYLLSEYCFTHKQKRNQNELAQVQSVCNGCDRRCLSCLHCCIDCNCPRPDLSNVNS